MNSNIIKKNLDEIDYYVDNDSYVFGESVRNKLHVAISQLREKILLEYNKIEKTLI